jgi:tRNA U34 5-methylaminomethyl-2-thiouridine-forming methyltransferase MnmC
MHPDQNHDEIVAWREHDVPVSERFQDPYYSLEDGEAETEFVFLRGNDLPSRFSAGFHIAELGFGVGLNLLCAWRAWVNSGVEGPLKFTSFEAFPVTKSTVVRALTQFNLLQESSEILVDNWITDSSFSIKTPTLDFSLIFGDARQSVPSWQGHADAWFLDGFSPAKNPELWEHDLMRAVAHKTKDGGTFATYSAAGSVRNALRDGGFDVQRVDGFGRKRHMAVGRKGGSA